MKRITSNILLLTAIQPLVISTGGLNSVIAGLIGVEMTGNKAMATIPVGAMMLGVALFVFPASKLQEVFGRKPIFVMASLVSSFAGLLAIYAIEQSLFPMYVAANFVFGTQLAVIGQYRYAAMESCSDKKNHARAVSMILIGGISSAVIGPELVQFAQTFQIFSHIYANAYLIIVVFHLLAALLLGVFFNTEQLQRAPIKAEFNKPEENVKPKMYRLAIITAAVAYGVMAMVMTTTPLAMKDMSFDIEHIKIVIQSHILAMYLPSLISARMIERLGIHKTLFIGSCFLISAFLIALLSATFFAFIVSLVLLGLGWNMLFLSGMTLLPQTHLQSQRFKFQGRFDFFVSSTQTASASISGLILGYLGWQGLQMLCLFVVFMLISLSLRFLDEFPKLSCCNNRLITALSKT